jgi:hypothetical protein
MVFLADIKKDLPEWPDDLIEQWLLYFANEPEASDVDDGDDPMRP